MGRRGGLLDGASHSVSAGLTEGVISKIVNMSLFKYNVQIELGR